MLAGWRERRGRGSDTNIGILDAAERARFGAKTIGMLRVMPNFDKQLNVIA